MCIEKRSCAGHGENNGRPEASFTGEFNMIKHDKTIPCLTVWSIFGWWCSLAWNQKIHWKDQQNYNGSFAVVRPCGGRGKRQRVSWCVCGDFDILQTETAQSCSHHTTRKLQPIQSAHLLYCRYLANKYPGYRYIIHIYIYTFHIIPLYIHTHI